MSNPLVSIVIPAFNHAKYLPEAIDSALRQTYSPIEVIVVNDGSTDNTREVCAAYGSKIKYIEQENRGPAAARNAAIRAAAGEYILPLDADDRIDVRFLELAFPLLLANKRHGYVYTDAILFGHGISTAVPWKRRMTWDMIQLLADNISTCTALFRKSDWEKVGGYCTDFVHGLEDWDFWLSLVERGKEGKLLPSPLFYYRQHHQSSRTNSLMQNTFPETYALLIQRHRELYAKHWEELLLFWSRRSWRHSQMAARFEDLYWAARPGRFERYGCPLPLAKLLRQVIRRLRHL